MVKLLILAVGLVVIFTILSCDGVRLPKNVIPTHYKVGLRTESHAGKEILDGMVQITVDVVEATRKIVLHGLGISVHNVIVFSVVGDNLGSPEVGYDSSHEQVILTMHEQLDIGKYRLWIKFETTNSKGWIVRKYDDVGGVQRYFLATQFEPTYARTAFPCFDEPGMKATFSLEIEHHKSVEADSNMPLIGTSVSLREDYLISRFEKTPKMSPYLLAFTITDGYRSSGSGNHTTKARGSLLEKTLYPLEVAKEILGVMDQYTGLPYKDYLPKLTHLEVPIQTSWRGAKATWGLIMYCEDRLILDPLERSVDDWILGLLTISHELAQMWFGNLVTHEWWDYVWLKEGFARLYMYYGLHLARPSERWMEWFNVDDAIFDLRINYKPDRASSILNMFRRIVGDAKWQLAIRNFLKGYQLDVVVPSDLYVELENATEGSKVFPANITIEQIMNSWMTSRGRPILKVERNYNDSTITISQRSLEQPQDWIEHLRSQGSLGLGEPQDWIIPYNYAEESNADFDEVGPVHWLTQPSTIIPTNATADQWILFSKRHFCAYQINYDERNWKLLTQALHSNISCMPRENRAQLFLDALQFSAIHQLDESILFDLLTSLPNETESLVWYAAFPIIKILKLDLRSVKYQDYFKTFLRHLTKRYYDNIQQSAPTSLYDELVRKSINFLACQAGNPDCLSSAKQTFQRSIQSNSSDLLPDDIFNVFCFGLQQANDAEFAWVLYEYKASTGNDRKQKQLLKALLCSKQSDRLRIVLKSIDRKYYNDIHEALQADLSAEQFWVLEELLRDDTFTDGLSIEIIVEVLVGMSVRKQSERAQAVMVELKEKFFSRMRQARIGYIYPDYTAEHGNPNNKMNKMLEEFVMRNNF